MCIAASCRSGLPCHGGRLHYCCLIVNVLVSSYWELVQWLCHAYMYSSHTSEIHVHVLMRDEKEERSKQGQTNNKAKQHPRQSLLLRK